MIKSVDVTYNLTEKTTGTLQYDFLKITMANNGSSALTKNYTQELNFTFWE
jgi:hypothetical protein